MCIWTSPKHRPPPPGARTLRWQLNWIQGCSNGWRRVSRLLPGFQAEAPKDATRPSGGGLRQRSRARALADAPLDGCLHVPRLRTAGSATGGTGRGHCRCCSSSGGPHARNVRRCDRVQGHTACQLQQPTPLHCAAEGYRRATRTAAASYTARGNPSEHRTRRRSGSPSNSAQRGRPTLRRAMRAGPRTRSKTRCCRPPTARPSAALRQSRSLVASRARRAL